LDESLHEYAEKSVYQDFTYRLGFLRSYQGHPAAVFALISGKALASGAAEAVYQCMEDLWADSFSP
jgi:hypothetical protein